MGRLVFGLAGLAYAAHWLVKVAVVTAVAVAIGRRVRARRKASARFD